MRRFSSSSRPLCLPYFRTLPLPLPHPVLELPFPHPISSCASILSFFLSGHVLDAVKRWQYFLLRETLGAPARIPSVVCSARKAAWVCACGLEIGTWQGFYVLRDDISGGRTHIIFGIFFLDPWSLFSVV